MPKEITEQIKQEAKNYFQDACPSHDWTHVERVYNLCLDIGKIEKANTYILKLSSLLHDIGRQKEKENPDKLDHAKISTEIASEILSKYNISDRIKNQVLYCISTHRFRNNEKPETLEAKILFDADKLDCIGAIGVARAYAFAGSKRLKLYSNKNHLGTGYEENHSPVTEFKYKLIKVKDKLFTETAKKIAEQRHEFMEHFFEQLNNELKQ